MIHELIRFYENENAKLLYQEVVLNTTSISSIQKLSKKYPNYPIKELLTLHRLREANRNKISNIDELLVTEKSVQQASSTNVAVYHGKLFSGYKRIADLCCGIGNDLLYLSSEKDMVYAIDYEEEHLKAAEYNTQSFGYHNISFLFADAVTFDKYVDAIFADPDRRKGNTRIINPDDYSPSLSSLFLLRNYCNAMYIKLSPMINYDKIECNEPYTLYFISENRELKEIGLGLGDFAIPDCNKKVVLLQYGRELVWKEQVLAVSPLQEYIFEPDPAIIRSDMVQQVGYDIGFHLIDPNLPLLTGTEYASDFELGWFYTVIEQFSFNVKALQKKLVDRDIGRIVIKTRGYKETVEDFRRKIRLRGNNEITLFIINISKRIVMVLCDKVELTKVD